MTDHTVPFDRSSIPVAEAARPFLFPGGPIGILIIHGYGGSPGGFHQVGRLLQARGYTAAGMLVGGHGQGVRALAQATADHWNQSVERAVDELGDHCQRLVILGISFGGDLALSYVTAHQSTIAGVITLNTPLRYRVAGWKRRMITLLSRIRPYYRKPHLTPEEEQWNLGVGSLNSWPIDGILDTERYIDQQVLPGLRLVTVPALIISSQDDPYVERSSAEQLMAEIGSDIKKLHWLNSRSHRPLRDPVTTQEIVTVIDDFVRQHIA